MKKNKGWYCRHCRMQWLGVGSLDKAMLHIKEKHKQRWISGNWALTAIK